MVDRTMRTDDLPVDHAPHLTDLSRFANAFEAEEVLRKTVLSLLNKMPTVSGAEETHGQQEYGKDIVFYGRGGLDEKRLYACVVKNTPINGSVDSNGGARTVFLQAEQAFDTPYVTISGNKEQVEHVYIICPHELSQITRNSISGKLRTGQVTFFCGSRLLGLFERHWPDFLLFDSDLLQAYISSLQTTLDQNGALASIFFQKSILGDLSSTLSKVYVKPHFHQEMQTFDLADPQIVDVSDIESKLTLERVKRLGDSLVAVGNVLDTLSLDRPSDDGGTAKALAKKLRSLAGRLRTSWDEAYKPFKVRSIGDGPRHGRSGGGKMRFGRSIQENETVDHTPRKSEMQLVVGGALELGVECRQILETARPLIGEFRTRVVQANRFAEGEALTPIETLQSEEYKLFCGVQENSRLNPRALIARPANRSLEFPPDLLAQHSGSLLITGSAGLGKTSFCKWNTLADAERYVKRKSNVLPVFVPLHQFAQGELGSFEDTFGRSPEIKRLLTTKGADGKSPRMRFYLDGLDEIPYVERQRELLELARTFILSRTNIDLVLTSREHVFGLGWLPRVRLRELDSAGIRELVGKWLDQNQAQVDDFFDQLAIAGPSLLRLMGIPLLATLIIAVYRNNKKLPESKVRLYEIFVDLLSGGWDHAKGVKRPTRFGGSVKISVLGHLATLLQFNRTRDFEEPIFRNAVKHTLPSTANEWDHFLNEIVQDGLLTRVGASYTFAHQSFQEYFAAQSISDPSGRKQTKILKWYLKGDDWWREVLSFFLGLAGNPADLRKWIAEGAESVASKSSSDLVERQKYLEGIVDEYYPDPVPSAETGRSVS